MIGATSGSTGNANADNLVAYYSSHFSGTGDGNYYGVRFANLVGSTLRNGTYNRQDQFVIMGIPEPGSLLIWGGAIGLAGFFTRRRKVA
jgi:hypothetical protein